MPSSRAAARILFHPRAPKNPDTRETATAADRITVAALSGVTLALLSTGWVLSGVLVDDGTPPLAVAAGRAASSGVVLAAIAGAAGAGTRRAMARAAARRWTLVQLAFIGYFLYFVGTMLGVQHIGASRTGLVVALLPCVTFIVGAAAFGEKASARKGFGSALAVAGAVGYAYATSPKGGTKASDLMVGGGWALVATVAFAVYNFQYRAKMHDLPPLSVLPVVFGVATVMLFPAAALTERLGDVSARQWFGVAVLGAFLTAPVYVTAHEIVLRRGPLYMAVISLVVPFLVRIGEWAVGNAPALDAGGVAALVLCVGGVWFTVSDGGRPKPIGGSAATSYSRETQ